MSEKINSKIKFPPADVILGVLNQNDLSMDKLLEFYLPYMRGAATFPVLDSNGNQDGAYICDDLVQEMSYKIVHAVDVLRTKLLPEQESNCSSPVIIILK